MRQVSAASEPCSRNHIAPDMPAVTSATSSNTFDTAEEPATLRRRHLATQQSREITADCRASARGQGKVEFPAPAAHDDEP